jgi:hypothetical protein
MAVKSWSTSTSAVISTNSMLNSIFGTVPSSGSLLTATYIGKDIIGQLGGLGYAWKTGKKADKEPLSYVTKGTCIQQASFYLENCSMLLTNPVFILPFLGISSLLKNVSFISIGAVSASNLQKIFKGNIGEYYTKVASINTLSSTLGMLTGLGIVYAVPSYTVRTFVIMPILTGISLYSVRRATKLAENL